MCCCVFDYCPWGPPRWSAFSSKRFNTETNNRFVLSCTPVPDLAVLLFSTSFAPRLPALTTATTSSTTSDSDEGSGSDSGSDDDSSDSGISPAPGAKLARAQLLGGFAGYNFNQSDDLAALVWMRGHLQLLLDLAVSATVPYEVHTRVAVQQHNSMSSGPSLAPVMKVPSPIRGPLQLLQQPLWAALVSWARGSYLQAQQLWV